MIHRNNLANPADGIIVSTATNGRQMVAAARRILDWPDEPQCVGAAR